VVAPLWRLRDDDARRLFDRFYHHLDAGKPLDVALAEAASDLRQLGAPAEAWAGLVAFGRTDQPVVLRQTQPTNKRLRGLGWISVLVLVVLIAWFFNHREGIARVDR